MSSESKQWLLEIVLILLAAVAIASAPARGTASHRSPGAGVASR